jgi:hypothetical protein
VNFGGVTVAVAIPTPEPAQGVPAIHELMCCGVARWPLLLSECGVEFRVMQALPPGLGTLFLSREHRAHGRAVHGLGIVGDFAHLTFVEQALKRRTRGPRERVAVARAL